MPLPTITTDDLARILEDLFTRAIASDANTRQDLRDLRRCNAVLSAPEVRECLNFAASSTLANDSLRRLQASGNADVRKWYSDLHEKDISARDDAQPDVDDKPPVWRATDDPDYDEAARQEMER